MPFCSRCGREVPLGIAYCPNCGAPIAPQPKPAAKRKWVLIAAPIAAVLLAIVVVLAALAPYQVRAVEVRPSLTLVPPTLTLTLTLRNDALFDVRVDTVLKVEFTVRESETVEKEYYFDTITIAAGGVGRTSTTINLALEGRPTEATILFRVRGPISTNTITYSRTL